MYILPLIHIIFDTFPFAYEGFLSLFSYSYNDTQGLCIIHISTMIGLILFSKNLCIDWFTNHSRDRIKHDITCITLATTISIVFFSIKPFLLKLFQTSPSYFLLFNSFLLLYNKTLLYEDKKRQYITFKDSLLIGIAYGASITFELSSFITTITIAIIIGLEKKYAFYIFIALKIFFSFYLSNYYLYKSFYLSFYNKKTLFALIAIGISSKIVFFLYSFLIKQYEKNKIWYYGVYASICTILLVLMGK